MKIDRLIGIVSILLQADKTTAPELASLFEVSRRTINRDIEDLCKAGIPIMTVQGSGGGISIMDGYRINRTILSSKDMSMILAGLRSLDSISGSNYCTKLMEKLQIGSSRFISGRDSILIDLSSWNKDALEPKIQIIQSAIEKRRLLTFEYHSPDSCEKRSVEPYYLIFRWSSWYLYGWCEKRKDYRLFKLNRMLKVTEGDKNFEYRDVSLPDLSDEKVFPKGIKVKALFAQDVKWRLIEDFGPESFTPTPEGKLLFINDSMDPESVTTWFLTFRDKVEVLEPKEIRDKLKETGKMIFKIYEE